MIVRVNNINIFMQIYDVFKINKHDFSYLLHSHFENAKEALATLATNIPVHLILLLTVNNRTDSERH